MVVDEGTDIRHKIKTTPRNKNIMATTEEEGCHLEEEEEAEEVRCRDHQQPIRREEDMTLEVVAEGILQMVVRSVEVDRHH